MQTLPRRQDRARGPLGLAESPHSPGGRGSFVYENGQRGPPPRAVFAREIREGVSAGSAAGSLNSSPHEQLDSRLFREVLTMDDLHIA